MCQASQTTDSQPKDAEDRNLFRLRFFVVVPRVPRSLNPRQPEPKKPDPEPAMAEEAPRLDCQSLAMRLPLWCKQLHAVHVAKGGLASVIMAS